MSIRDASPHHDQQRPDQQPPDRLRRRAAGTALLVGPLLLVAGTMITPATPADSAEYLAVLTEQQARSEVGALLFVIGHLVLAPTVLWLARQAQGRGSLAAQIGGAAAMTGAILFAGLGFTRLFEVAVAAALAPTEGAAVLDAVGSMPGMAALALPAILGLVAGTLTLLVALYRAGAAPVWLPVVLLLGFAGVMTGGDGTPAGVAGSTLLAVVFGYLGVRALGPGHRGG